MLNFGQNTKRRCEMEKSIWLQNRKGYIHPIENDHKKDICIIGGGLTGIYTAYLLAKNGHNVIVLEAKEFIGDNATSHSTGKLTTQHQTIYQNLDFKEAKLHYKLNRLAIEEAVEGLPKSIVQPAISYLYSVTEEGKEKLQKEYQVYKELEIPSHDTTDIELSIPITYAIGIENEYQIHPFDFLQHYTKKALEYGAEIYTNARVQHIDVKNKQVETEQYTIQFNKLIISSHYPIESIKHLQTTKMTINRTYLNATKCSELLKGQYLQIEQPNRTIRTALINGEKYFIYGGTNHQAGHESKTKDYYNIIKDELIKDYDLQNPQFEWSNQDIQTVDSKPYIGPIDSDENTIFIATGYCKWGMSQSIVAAQLLTKYIENEHSDGFSLYTPTRLRIGKMILNSLQMTESFIESYVKHMETPKCTHLGCKTLWNEADETWDCPCHGSRFASDGSVLEGPAVYPLKLKD